MTRSTIPSIFLYGTDGRHKYNNEKTACNLYPNPHQPLGNCLLFSNRKKTFDL